jgi:hypothetical protein
MTPAQTVFRSRKKNPHKNLEKHKKNLKPYKNLLHSTRWLLNSATSLLDSSIWLLDSRKLLLVSAKWHHHKKICKKSQKTLDKLSKNPLKTVKKLKHLKNLQNTLENICAQSMTHFPSNHCCHPKKWNFIWNLTHFFMAC